MFLLKISWQKNYQSQKLFSIQWRGDLEFWILFVFQRKSIVSQFHFLLIFIKFGYLFQKWHFGYFGWTEYQNPFCQQKKKTCLMISLMAYFRHKKRRVRLWYDFENISWNMRYSSYWTVSFLDLHFCILIAYF